MRAEQLTDSSQVQALIDGDEPAWIFKHSTACPVSARAYQAFGRYVDEHEDDPAGVIVVQEHRDLSNEVAEQTGVRHQTPQVLLVRGGQVLWHSSHMRITRDAMERAHDEHAG